MTRRPLVPLLLALLGPPAAAAQAVPADSVPRGVVVGTVLDAVTGEPLAGAVVTLAPAPGGAVSPAAVRSGFWAGSRSVMTDLSGTYRFADVPAGPWRLLVRRLGYRPALVDLSLRDAAALRISVGLAVQPVLLEPEQVEAPAAPFVGAGLSSGEPADARVDLELHRQRTYTGSDVRLLTRAEVVEAVTLGETDLFRAFHRLPGVSSRDDFSAAFWTRGAPWSHTRVTFDGLPLFNPVHTVGVFSGLNPDGIGAVVFHPGVRSAQIGEGAAAALEVASRRPPRGFAGNGELSVVSARAAGGGGGERSGVFVAARRSYVDLLTDVFADSTGLIPYALLDLTGRVDLRVGPATTLEMSGLWERDEVRGTVRDLLRDTEGHWGNGAARLSLVDARGAIAFRHTVGFSHFGGHLRLRGARTTDLGAAPTHQPTDNTITYLVLASQLEPASGRWAAGWELVSQRQRYDGPAPRPYPEAILADTVRLAEQLGIPAVWGEVRVARGAVLAVAGLRAEWAPGVRNAGPVALGPRVSVRWSVDQRTSASVGWGRSFQYTQALAPAGPGVGPDLHITDVWLMAGDTMPAIRADVVTAGVERWLDASWLAAVNVYARRADGVAEPWPEPGPLRGDRPIMGVGTNRAAGLELSARRLAGRITGSVSYTLGVSRMQVDSLSYAAGADRRHVFNATGLVRLSRSLRLGGALTAASGAPYTQFVVDPVLCQNILACEGGAVGDTLGLTTQSVGAPAELRARPYLGLDLLAEWERTFTGGWSLGAWFQLRNVLNLRNAVTYAGSFDPCTAPGPDDIVRGTRCDRFDRGVPLLPLAGIRVTF